MSEQPTATGGFQFNGPADIRHRRGHGVAFVPVLLAALAPAAARAGDAPATFAAQSSASESGSGEEAVQRIVNTTFAFDHVYQRRGADRYVLYELQVRSEQPRDAEGPMSQLTVTARNRGTGAYSEVLWTAHDNANTGEPLGEYYRTTLFGCCAAENVQRWYDAWTGKLAFAATAPPRYAEIPNTPVHYAFAWLSANAMDGFDRERFPRGVGLATITDGDATRDRVLIEAADPDSELGFTPELALADPSGAVQANGDTFELWQANFNPDPAGVSGFDLVADWGAEAGGPLRLPVVAGRFDLAHAVLPAGVTVRRVAD